MSPPSKPPVKETPALKRRQSMTGIELKAGNDEAADRGIPPLDAIGFLKFLPVFLLGPIITSALGSAIAWRIYTRGNTALYDKNITKLVEGELGYQHLAASIFNIPVAWVNSYPMLYKSMIMRFTSGNLRANMQIYKQYGKDASSGYVLLETHGPVGSYNRANRSLTHFVENSIPMALFIVLSASSWSIWKAEGTILNRLAMSDLNTPLSMAST